MKPALRNLTSWLTLLALVAVAPMSGQQTEAERLQKQREKLNLILKVQDRRSPVDNQLINFLADEDTVVRRRAVLAYGSIQDTNALPLLVEKLSDGDTEVELNAAFAIGQTASLLNEEKREKLAHDLIWTRIAMTHPPSGKRRSPADQIIEEIGKFGGEQALTDLLLQYANSYPALHTEALTMSVARFAVRGITTKESVEFLVRTARYSDEAAWQAVYALQRSVNLAAVLPHITDLVPLYKHRSPLVRMYFAALMGKVKDTTTSLDPLERLASFDGDWRVRVNALRALGNFDLQRRDEILRTFKRAISDENMHVALTALTALAASGLKEDRPAEAAVTEIFENIERIAVNSGNTYLWQLQAEAATTLAKLRGPEALAVLKPSAFPQPKLQSQLLRAIGMTGNSEALAILGEFSGHETPEIQRGALEGLAQLAGKNPSSAPIVAATYDAALTLLQTDDVALVTTSAGILGDSLFRRPASTQHLLERLKKLRIPDDIEAMQEIIGALGKLGDSRSVPALEEIMNQPDRSVALASASALKAITGKEYRAGSLLSTEPLYADFDFPYLGTLPDTVQVEVETIRGKFTLELYKNAAPFTVMSFLKLAEQRGFFQGVTFHRVVPNFVIQGGDPRGDGWGGPGYAIRSEFTLLKFEVGTLGMASAGKDTEGSQFFVTHSPQPHLDGKYTVFGKVVAGMDVVNLIQVDDRIFNVRRLE